jgi:hypothetical protein
LSKEWVHLVLAQLIFNIEKCGFRDWGERKPKSVWIIRRVKNARLHDPADCIIRHQTLICCIIAAGDAYCPLSVSAELSVRQIFETKVRDNTDLNVEIASSPYVTQAIFNNYVDQVLTHPVVSNHSLAGSEKRGDSSI